MLPRELLFRLLPVLVTRSLPKGTTLVCLSSKADTLPSSSAAVLREGLFHVGSCLLSYHITTQESSTARWRRPGLLPVNDIRPWNDRMPSLGEATVVDACGVEVGGRFIAVADAVPSIGAP